MAHSVIWNRFWNGTGGKGKSIPLDLHLEHLNNFLKSFMRGLGPNLSEMSAVRISKSIGILKELMDKTDTDLELSRPTGIHQVAREQEDVLTLVNVLREAQLFQDQPGRQFYAFPNFRKKRIGKTEIPGIMAVDEVQINGLEKCPYLNNYGDGSVSTDRGGI